MKQQCLGRLVFGRTICLFSGYVAGFVDRGSRVAGGLAAERGRGR